MNREYVKIKGYTIWFLKFDTNSIEGNLSEDMATDILMSKVCQMHDPSGDSFYTDIIKNAAIRLDYPQIAKKYGTILIQSIGSYMPLRGNEIIETKICEDFPQ